jgi:hypothetical protein
MSSLLQSYPVFKSGAVLKHSDLNAIVAYLENQIQLSRKHLDGFGIVEGLEVSCATASGATTIAIAPGVAVMPNGQLVEIQQPCKFGFTKIVAPTSEEGKSLSKCFADDYVELTNDAGATPLSADEKRCILIYVKNSETVSPTELNSCVRQSDVNEQKTIELRFFLGEPKRASVGHEIACFSNPCLPQLLGEDLTEGAFERALKLNIEIGIREIQQAYEQLRKCFPELFCGEDFGNLKWILELIKVDPKYTTYVFDYLKTLISAYNELIQTAYLTGPYPKAARNLCPQILSLGKCGKDCTCRQYWQSAMEHADERDEAVFYAKRLIALTEKKYINFDLVEVNLDATRSDKTLGIKDGEPVPLHLTPSRSDMFPLSRRAIPFYINPRAIAPHWSFQLSSQHLENTIPHYVLDYCENHLCYTEGCDFVRVEGHVGMGLDETLKKLHDCRKHLNLPFEYIALELEEDATQVKPLWQPHFDDLERLFQLQRSYFLAAMDAFYNLTPSLNKNFITNLVELAEHATCYQNFDYQDFIAEIKGFLDSLGADNILTNIASHTVLNIFDGLKIIDRSKKARLRQLFMDRFLHCHEGFEPMCGVPKGGTLAILYKRLAKDQQLEQVEMLESSRVIIPNKIQGIVVGDLAIPCCDVDLTKTPVAVFSVSIRFEYEQVDFNADGIEGESEGRTRLPRLTITLRNLSLHCDMLEWVIESTDAAGIVTDDTPNWALGNCGSMSRVFELSDQVKTFELTDFKATLTAKKEGKSDIYSETFQVPTPADAAGAAIGDAFSMVAKARASTPAASVSAERATAKAVATVAEDPQKAFDTIQRQRQNNYRAYTAAIESDKVINDNKAFNTAKPFIFFPKSKAALHQQFSEASAALITEIGGTKDAKRLEKYTKLLLYATFAYLDKLVQDKEQINDVIIDQVRANRQYLEGKGITAEAFIQQWTTQVNVSLPEDNAEIKRILDMLQKQ